ncbi:nuclear transport factor 2 family protein [Rhodococcus erythropolis]|uniref:nuclear transport factor 2 family protein n=1 Tax=Rhodococcus erythropolis TaxID=1833 RepID=UPI000878421F|nr:nuclear transport factor 2 family protein [Rhodococcus erythropolis]OFV76675.1 hypothetical protein RERY_26480 [Rhodococcus erythropolis]
MRSNNIHAVDSCGGPDVRDYSPVDALVAKQEIYEVLARFLRAADRGDVEDARRCYLPGATEDHGGVFTGTADDYIDHIAGAITHPRSLTTHAMTNVLVELDGDKAHVESYVLAFARIKTSDGIADTLTAARLIDRFGFEDGRWGIRHRALRWDWNHDMATAEGWIFGMLAPETSLKKSKKFPDDLIYTRQTQENS